MQANAPSAAPAHCYSRKEVQPWLPLLDDWLLPDAFHGVQHTWPLLYRSDGDGRFHACLLHGELASFCAHRLATLMTADGPRQVALLGSVVTHPERRGRGHASSVLTTALTACDREAEHVLLWAENPRLYANHGFQPGPEEPCLLLARRPRPDLTGVRPARLDDLQALHALHEAKPQRIRRTPAAMATLLSTPGLLTLVLEDQGTIQAYACCGKGADLQGFWHEVGGTDAAVAHLLAAALHLADQTQAMFLLPPYRPQLGRLLGPAVIEHLQVAGPMVRSTAAPLPPAFLDGLDSV
jgi:GNAT superfamily N-acetyltransferase